jgi:hypothetical protein
MERNDSKYFIQIKIYATGVGHREILKKTYTLKGKLDEIGTWLEARLKKY